MIRPPFMARVAAGMAITAYEETLKLPSTAVALPMTTVSQILQTTMRIQQAMTSLAIKGDQLFEIFGAPPTENPEWAVFDDDALPSTARSGASNGAEARTGSGSVSAPGRYALYSIPPASEAEAGAGTPASESSAAAVTAEPPESKAPAKKTSAAKKAPAKKNAAPEAAPEIVEYLDYDSLTLAQLRARLRTLSVDDLTDLLDYENTHAARSPFVTMLSNRITTARGK
ncbi:lipid droplet-associated protein [Rhodococcus chondri]|uniref:Lipid droplet-associated protein n=1 Tax=Rhodococcus chondri TaxID=3065941 RepID=A0ABU7JW34_9NOCA|nr:lipid droplet-associated protein [Rhodococcus sp. CC-R104]MEE2034243.1 lipid droplet-associated protein [Rhodococcus sp. CC-R104]